MQQPRLDAAGAPEHPLEARGAGVRGRAADEAVAVGGEQGADVGDERAELLEGGLEVLRGETEAE